MMNRTSSKLAIAAVISLSLASFAPVPKRNDDFLDLTGPPVPTLVDTATQAKAEEIKFEEKGEPSHITFSQSSQSAVTLESLVPTTKTIWLNIMLTVGTIGTWRGFGMLLRGIRKYMDDSKAFYLGQDLNHSPINLHTIEKQGDKNILSICTVDNETLSGILDNSSAVRMFKNAAKRCTAEQPLPSLEFGEVSDFFGRLCLRGLQPGPDRLLQEFNKRVVDHYSTISTSGHIARSLGDNTTNDIQYLIPICEVNERKERWFWLMKSGVTERNIVFAAVPSQLFQQFGDEQFVEKLKRDNPRLESRIEQIEKAWAARATYANGVGKESGEDFFPDVKISKATVERAKGKR